MLYISCSSSNESLNASVIAACFNCEQVQGQSRLTLETIQTRPFQESGTAETLKNKAVLRNSIQCFV